MDRKVEGKIVVVTGGAQSLGLAMVKSFLQKGAKTVIILDNNEQQGNNSATSLQAEYGLDRAVFYKCDVSTDLDIIYDKIINTYKTVDVLINNAGILNEVNVRATVQVNITAVMEWTMKFLEHMRKDKGGKTGTIINVSSIYGYRIIPHIPIYQGSKFAVLGFSKSIGNDFNFKKTGVRVVTLCPGITLSNLSKEITDRSVWDKDILQDFIDHLKNDYEWQNPEAIGNGTVEIFKKATSGSAWFVEGANPAKELNF